MQQNFKIVGSGSYLPQGRLTAKEIDNKINKPAGWTKRKFGNIQRHQCRLPETMGSMANAAASEAMNDAKLSWNSIDLIIDASTCRHQPIPCNAAILQNQFGEEASGIPCFDIQSTCLSFMIALNTANHLLQEESNYQNILIISAEAGLAGVNWSSPESACIFSDGAAAVVLQKSLSGSSCHFTHQTYASHVDICSVKGGGHSLPVFDYTEENDDLYRFQMDGPNLYKIARKYFPKSIEDLIAKSSLSKEDLYAIPHQASAKSLELMRRLVDFSKENFYNETMKYGNMIAASIPFALNQCIKDSRVKEGDDVMLLGTSAGYSQAALIFKL